MVRVREHQANGEPSLVVGIGHVSWTVLSLIALTRQKQLSKSRQQQANQRPNARHVSLKLSSSRQFFFM
jgi:hypothetical protein